MMKSITENACVILQLVVVAYAIISVTDSHSVGEMFGHIVDLVVSSAVVLVLWLGKNSRHQYGR